MKITGDFVEFGASRHIGLEASRSVTWIELIGKSCSMGAKFSVTVIRNKTTHVTLRD